MRLQKNSHKKDVSLAAIMSVPAISLGFYKHRQFLSMYDSSFQPNHISEFFAPIARQAHTFL
jgi:hypothetical protein